MVIFSRAKEQQMEQLPDELIQKITLQQIIFLRDSIGWNHVHKYLKNFHLVLRLTLNQYPYEYHFGNIYRSTIAVKPNDILKTNRLIRIKT